MGEGAGREAEAGRPGSGPVPGAENGTGTAGAGAAVRPRRLGWALAATLGLVAGLAVLLGLAYRRQAELLRELSRERALGRQARDRAEEFGRELERQREMVRVLEARLLRQAEDVSSLRTAGREARELYAESEKERGALLRRGEEKSQELERRHQRIVALQEEVERLASDCSALADAAHERELAVRREYEARLRQERSRREVLEEKLAVLRELEALRDRLARLADEIEAVARPEGAR